MRCADAWRSKGDAPVAAGAESASAWIGARRSFKCCVGWPPSISERAREELKRRQLLREAGRGVLVVGELNAEYT